MRSDLATAFAFKGDKEQALRILEECGTNAKIQGEKDDGRPGLYADIRVNEGNIWLDVITITAKRNEDTFFHML